jgi:hypothetical protein
VTKTNAQREVDATTTTIIASYNNINQQKQLKKAKREKTLIFKIRKQSEKNNLRTLFVKKLIKRLQRVEKIKEDVMMTKRFFNENVKSITRSKKIKNRLIINNSYEKCCFVNICDVENLRNIDSWSARDRRANEQSAENYSTHWKAEWDFAFEFANRKNSLIKKRHQWRKRVVIIDCEDSQRWTN